MRLDPEQLGWLKLVLAPDLGPGRLDALGLEAERLGCLPDRSDRELKRLGLDAKAVRALRDTDPERLEAALAWLDHPAHHLVTRIDTYYPPLLRRIPDAPLALFVNGDPGWLLRPQIAIVGSRNATAGGLSIAREFAEGLTRAGLVISSGLALGIDGAAHAAALDADGATVAVAGTGLDRVYPARHRDLAHRIVDNGAVISSFAPGIGPRAGHFPARNRIISGMSAGVVVIEAGIQSGSLITARLAGEQGREVFAVPGSIRNPMARGCHRLIRQGARLVESPAEIVEELQPLITELAGELRGLLDLPATPAAGERSPDCDGSVDPQGIDPQNRDDKEVEALLAAVGYDPTSVDEIVARTDLTTQAISAMLLELELQGRVAALGGGRYSRTGIDQETN
ncbi:MAG: DNA-processing protein DprA [Wenzhouxiangellaceae bacterium]|nr:DNA-processing protein DprA [Wenzhouxiangellaceae bacterium]MBS3745653.1 DNA-processing protein DprA [Wenzhouxiangellaceae bacterium]